VVWGKAGRKFCHKRTGPCLACQAQATGFFQLASFRGPLRAGGRISPLITGILIVAKCWF